MNLKTDLNCRKTTVLRDGLWVVVPLCDVTEGTSFRLYEPDGSFIGEFVALKDGFIDDSTGLHGIMCAQP
jgi:hypothetical protein